MSGAKLFSVSSGFSGVLGAPAIPGIQHFQRLRLLHLKALEHIAHFDVVEIRNTDTALKSRTDLVRIILESAQGNDSSRVNHDIVAQDSYVGVAFQDAVLDRTTRDHSDALDTEGVTYLGAAEVRFFNDRREQSGNGLLQLVEKLVDDRVQSNVHVLALRQIGSLTLGPHVERNDDCVRSRGQTNVGLGYGTHACLDHLQLYLVVRDPRQHLV